MTEKTSDTYEILENLERQMSNVCYHEPASPVEQKIANALACLIAVIRHERKAIEPSSVHGERDEGK